MRIRIGCIRVMHIICRHQIYACLFAHPKELCIDCFLFRDAMILKLQEKVAPSENSFVASGGTHCFFVHTTHQIFLDFSCQTRRQGNDTFMIFFQDFHIHTRFIIETFCKTF